MKIIRYLTTAGRPDYGLLHSDGRTTRLTGDLYGQLTDTGEPAAVAKLLAPIEPRDIICIGLNYRKHAAEGNQPIPEWPVVFMKNSGALQHPGDPILLPRRLRSDAVDYECELAVVIGRECHNVSKADALQYVLGYTCANDVILAGARTRCHTGGSAASRSSSGGTSGPTPCPETRHRPQRRLHARPHGTGPL